MMCASMQAIAQSTGRNGRDVKKDFEEKGDLGTVAQTSRSSQQKLSFGAKPKALMASNVLKQFREVTSQFSFAVSHLLTLVFPAEQLAAIKGEKSQDRKVRIAAAAFSNARDAGALGSQVKVIQLLLTNAVGDEACWIVRAVAGKLRIGLAEVPNVFVDIANYCNRG